MSRTSVLKTLREGQHRKTETDRFAGIQASQVSVRWADLMQQLLDSIDRGETVDRSVWKRVERLTKSEGAVAVHAVKEVLLLRQVRVYRAARRKQRELRDGRPARYPPGWYKRMGMEVPE